MVIHSRADLCHCADIKCVAQRLEDQRKVGEDRICERKCVCVLLFFFSWRIVAWDLYDKENRHMSSIKKIKEKTEISRVTTLVLILLY